MRSIPTTSTTGSLAAPWDAAAFATGFVDGKEHVTTVLWHADESDAESNASALPEMMATHAGCVEDADVDDRLVIATCPIDEPVQNGWANYIVRNYPLFEPVYCVSAWLQ